MQEQMKNKILYTDEARCDLDSIWDYIALDLQNQQAAERLVNKIMDRVDQLEDFAESGMLLSSISEVIGEERFLVCENYLIFTIPENRWSRRPCTLWPQGLSERVV